jgi:hypothetical protein
MWLAAALPTPVQLEHRGRILFTIYSPPCEHSSSHAPIALQITMFIPHPRKKGILLSSHSKKSDSVPLNHQPPSTHVQETDIYLAPQCNKAGHQHAQGWVCESVRACESLRSYYRSALSLRMTAGPSHISFARLYDSGTYSSQGQQEAVYPVK